MRLQRSKLRGERQGRVVQLDPQTKLSLPKVSMALGEYGLAKVRIWVSGLCVLWASWWWLFPGPLVATHLSVMCAVFVCLVSTGWFFLYRATSLREFPFSDALGSALSLAAICMLMIASPVLFAPLVIVFPLLVLVNGVLFGRSGMVASLAVMAVMLLCFVPLAIRAGALEWLLIALSGVVLLPLAVGRIWRLMLKDSEASRDLQNQFVSTMGHELRTPLNAIIGGAQLIDTQQLVGDQRRLIESIISNASALHRRVNEVLDVAAINGGRMELEQMSFALSDIQSTLEDTCRLLAEERGVRLSVAAQRLTGTVQGDLGRMEQVLINLTTNAVKFTPSGGQVKVLISHTPSKRPGYIAVHATVSDTGIGIRDEDKGRIFDAFHQIQGRDARRGGGIGLGLYIVKSISDLMHGSLAVMDNPGGGTIFQWTIELPLRGDGIAEVAQTLAAMLDEHRSRVPSLRCLVVEDNATNVEVVGGILARAGHSMVVASDGQAGLKAIRASGLDLVFLDIHMPHMTGWDVLDRLAMSSGTQKTPPIIIFSADSDPGSVASAARLGAVAYLTKPVSTKKLLEAVELAYAVANDSGAGPRPMAQRDSQNWSFQLSELREVVDEGNFTAFLKMCLTGFEQSLSAIEKSVNVRDYPTIAKHAHTLKNEFKVLAHAEGVRACDLIAQVASRRADCTLALEEIQRQVAAARLLIAEQPEFLR